MKTVTMFVAGLGLALASSAQAGALFSVLDNQNLFGSTYSIGLYRVGGDLAPNGPRLEPEGMVYHNGVLYVSGDASATSTPAESNGFLAAYPLGNLGSTPTAIGQFSSAGRAFGPEGITVNTRGAGFGSFSTVQPNIIAVDSAGGTVGRVLTVFNTATTTVQDTQSNFANTDDVAYVPGASAVDDRLAIIDGASVPPSIKYYSTASTPAVLPGGFNLVNQAKGLVFLPQAEAALFTPLATTDVLLVGVSPDFVGDTNKLLMYGLDGTLIASASLPAGTGAGLIGNIEALAYDPVSKQLFIGDETGANSQIAVLTIPAPSAAGLLGLCMLAMGRRRR